MKSVFSILSMTAAILLSSIVAQASAPQLGCPVGTFTVVGCMGVKRSTDSPTEEYFVHEALVCVDRGVYSLYLISPEQKRGGEVTVTRAQDAVGTITFKGTESTNKDVIIHELLSINPTAHGDMNAVFGLRINSGQTEFRDMFCKFTR